MSTSPRSQRTLVLHALTAAIVAAAALPTFIQPAQAQVVTRVVQVGQAQAVPAQAAPAVVVQVGQAQVVQAQAGQAQAAPAAVVGPAVAPRPGVVRGGPIIRPGGPIIVGPNQPLPPVIAPDDPKPAPPKPDADNTGKPDEPAGPQSREPGDLMSSGTMVYVDDSFGSVDKLRTAIRQANQGQAQLAINSFQDIVTNYGQKLVLLNDNSYVSITDYVRERLLAMPAVRNGMYDQIFGLDARREIDAAIENRDVATLIRVSDRYFPSTAALKGLAQAAEWYFERGEFSAAAQTWNKLLTHPLAGDRKAEFLFRSALAEHLAEAGGDAKALRDRLAQDFPDATGTLSGKEVKLLPKLDELLGLPAWEKIALTGDEWPAFGGGPSRSQLLNTNAAIGAKLWSVKLSDSPAGASGIDPNDPNQALLIRQQLMIRRGGGVVTDSSDIGALTSHPVLSNGALFIHLGNQVVAVSANAGTRLWAYPATPTIDQATRQYMQNYGINPNTSSAHNSVCVFGDQVFAVVPAGAAGGNPNLRLNGYNPDGMPVLLSRLVCLRRDDGQELWSRTSSEIKLEKEGALTFIGSPIVTRQGVFVMARKASDSSFTQQYLVRLDRDTGAPTWSCYLCSTSNGNNMYGGYNPLQTGNVPVPTLVDDILYISTGQGADCAVDANVGRILWLRVTATKPVNSNPNGGINGGGFIGGRVIINNGGIIQDDSYGGSPYLPSWKYNAPIIIGDKMVTTDSQVMRIYDRWNGKLVKVLKAADLIESGKVSGTPSLDVLAGAVGTKLVFSIKNAALCYDIASLISEKPQPEWIEPIASATAGTPLGRPFLSTSGYYIPFTKKLVRVSITTGKAEQWDWPQNEKNEAGKPGNILVTSEQVVVVNDLEVAGYSKWETARDNRLAKIKADPKNPALYLDLAEVSFRTDNQDVAQENMKQAVDLANAGSAPAGGSVADILGRLYRTNLSFAELLLVKNDPAALDSSRFYYEQCKASARSPEQGAEWRMRLSELALKQKKPDEAALLYSEILADPALRAAGYRDADGVQSAGATAERHIKDLVKANGAAIYARFETQAAALTQRAAAAKDAAGLQQVIDGYPNSAASLSAATTLAALYQEKQDWDNCRRVLWWLEPRVEGAAQAQAIANLATASIGLKKYPSAVAWAARGARQYQDFSWTDAGKKVSFSDLKARIIKVGGADLEGRLPTLPKAADNTFKMEPSPLGLPIDYPPPATVSGRVAVVGTQLLVPVESSPALRQSNLLFIRTGNQLHIRDALKNEDIGQPATLPDNADAVLLGATKDFAVLMQAGAAIGIDLKTHAAWTQTLKAPAGAPVRPGNPRNVVGRITVQVNAGNAQVIGGNVYVNGNMIGPVDQVTLIDDETGQVIALTGGSDADAALRAAFGVLGNAKRFTSARILNGNLLILAGNQIDAFNIETGKPAWTAPGADAISARLPDGIAATFVGNEDLIVAQVDAPTGKSTTFCAFDAETGKPSKQVKIDNERTLWRGLGDDGTLYVITDQAVAAYDMVSEQSRALWRRTDVGARFAGAAALTLDGLVAVNDNNDVMCLALESGEIRWKAGLGLDLLATANMAPTLRSTVMGDLVVFQSNDGSIAFKSQLQVPAKPLGPADRSPQLAWIGAKLLDSPPRLSLQASDSFLVEMMMGPVNNRSSRSDVFVIREATNGLTKVRAPVSLNPANTTEGPTIRSWQIVDGGIALETLPNGTAANALNAAGKIYLWRTKQNP